MGVVYGYFDRELKEYLMGGSVSPMDLFDLWKGVDFKQLGFMEKSPSDSEVGYQVERMCIDDREEGSSDDDMDYDVGEYLKFDGDRVCIGDAVYERIGDRYSLVEVKEDMRWLLDFKNQGILVTG